jgi:hypothetical protein
MQHAILTEAPIVPPGSANVFTARYPRAAARRVLAELAMLAEPPRVAGALDPADAGHVQLYVWFKQPMSEIAVALLGYTELAPRCGREVEPGPVWAVGRALTRLLGGP